MKFNRKVLIDQLENEIERREEEAARKTAESKIEHNRGRVAYVEQTRDAWNAFANTIKRRLRANAPVTHEDVPALLTGGSHGGWHTRLVTWNEKGPTEVIADTVSLRTLLALVQSSSTEEVTTYELERMGFKMAHLFRAR